ncbi:MAG: 2-C-methyl-D-erythritol 4-phosphate cytidylyltransferase [Kangiellaceae bacterium]|nr:2-C-methyl-D-erythritol 4-phosphate cytidylyltransferase [Kangiellaceae bacterium]
MNTSAEKIWAIIPAAGIGSRMQSDLPKQYLEVDGKTILEHSLSNFLEHSSIYKVVVPLHPNDRYWSKLKVSSHQKIITVAGGEERANSVLNALNYIIEQGGLNDWVMVHDAARPCLSSHHIDNLIRARENSADGAILAIPSVDTVKVSNARLTIDKTIPRETIWLAQTPQFFEIGKLAQAIDLAIQNDLLVTDEASAMEAQGFSPSLVIGNRKNLKITEPEDMMLASIWLNQ